MESDRYVCEICSKGFQRDQNLQMHKRRHKVNNIHDASPLQLSSRRWAPISTFHISLRRSWSLSHYINLMVRWQEVFASHIWNGRAPLLGDWIEQEYMQHVQVCVSVWTLLVLDGRWSWMCYDRYRGHCRRGGLLRCSSAFTCARWSPVCITTPAMRSVTLWASESTIAESTALKSNGDAKSVPEGTLSSLTIRHTWRAAAPVVIPATAVASSPGEYRRWLENLRWCSWIISCDYII